MAPQAIEKAIVTLEYAERKAVGRAFHHKAKMFDDWVAAMQLKRTSALYRMVKPATRQRAHMTIEGKETDDPVTIMKHKRRGRNRQG